MWHFVESPLECHVLFELPLTAVYFLCVIVTLNYGVA